MDDPGGITRDETILFAQRNRKQPHQKIVWRNVILFGYLHLAALYGMLLIFTSAKIATTVFGKFNNLHHICIILLFSNVFCLFQFSNFNVSSIFDWHYCWSS